MPASSASARRLDTSGEIVTTDGTVVGRHEGFERFTVGQRKGLRLAFGQPRYVVRIEADRRRVVIGTQEELARTELCAAEANWLMEERGEGRGERGEGSREKGEGRRAKGEKGEMPPDCGPGGEWLPSPSPLSPLPFVAR